MTVMLYQGDCLEVMATLPADSVDSIITDPPYGLSFMGKDWDHGVPGAAFWREALRVAKPGAMLLAFGGTRTWHRLAVAIEDAGWELRDTLMWLYGQGFPKSHDISKAIDKAAGAEREVVGYYHQGASNIGRKTDGKWGYGHDGTSNAGVNREVAITAPATDAAQQWDGWGTALKPAFEPVLLAMKPLDGTFAANALAWGVAGLNIDGGRIGTDDTRVKRGHVGAKMGANGVYGTSNGRQTTGSSQGRWPANVILDDEAARALDEQSGSGESRFYYCAKASRAERGEGNTHPTVKPLALMRYLCRLTATPTGGVVLDPFMGSGTTGMAAVMEGRDFIGIELDGDYLEIARRRITAAAEQALTPE